ncbi:DUF1963 domain-containing protein [Streptomyces sp. CA-294286]|uniref:DUF1963 domain-containing protein n=1 Tax=Streptomyces sp. CA-294286 TaxID=3240070 RepID=UPI003D8D9D8C
MEILRTLPPEHGMLTRVATLLNAEPGEPGSRASSLGGPLLWPADEPWPHCAQEDHWTYPVGGSLDPIVPGSVPMVPILQLFARDVPEVPFPPDKDLLQLVWCALNHDEGPHLVVPRLYWRREADVEERGLLAEAPVAGGGEYDEYNVPQEGRCTLSPSTAQDFPSRHDLPDGLRDTADTQERLSESHLVATKLGGWPCWTQPGDWPECPAGHRMEHLLTVTGDIQLGDCGGIYFFLCRQCPDHPWDARSDCH